ncbi:hypothetical protein HYALB_00000524 [Hymenoscyphus albidus]|uniref:Ricin B lectin domain-containing protein n=1 Tax=Hymenoscyphus albidus TaxID=595503 RepID=A0A9N9QDB0_9HELO|nr:hypothetical protein HYALB_00000524 [Hymenoscyphus albidus]
MTALQVFFLSALALTLASPIQPRVVASLNQAAFEEAQQRDAAATRAFSSTAIKTSTGQCLAVDQLSGDFRANLTPIKVAECDGSTGQQWDIITAGKHNDKAGTILVVNTLTQACMNFDPRRAAGNTVIMFSCGGRADGGGAITNSQQFAFAGGAGPVSFEPQNALGTCFAATAGNVLDQAPCKAGDASQTFTFEDGASSSPTPAPVPAKVNTAKPAASSVVASSVAAPNSAITQAPLTGGNPTTAVPVSRAGGILQPSAAAEANKKDTTATLAFTSSSLKSSTGECLTIDPLAGDFRQNLIPVTLSACTGAPGQKFDLIAKGLHNNAANSTLVVSSLTNGCLNFDDRRAKGDTVILFSCGGRADGEGGTTGSQLFAFDGGDEILLQPQSGNGAVCLAPSGRKLDSGACTGDAGQKFSIEG